MTKGYIAHRNGHDKPGISRFQTSSTRPPLRRLAGVCHMNRHESNNQLTIRSDKFPLKQERKASGSCTQWTSTENLRRWCTHTCYECVAPHCRMPWHCQTHTHNVPCGLRRARCCFGMPLSSLAYHTHTLAKRLVQCKRCPWEFAFPKFTRKSAASFKKSKKELSSFVRSHRFSFKSIRSKAFLAEASVTTLSESTANRSKSYHSKLL